MSRADDCFSGDIDDVVLRAGQNEKTGPVANFELAFRIIQNDARARGARFRGKFRVHQIDPAAQRIPRLTDQTDANRLAGRDPIDLGPEDIGDQPDLGRVGDFDHVQPGLNVHAGANIERGDIAVPLGVPGNVGQRFAGFANLVDHPWLDVQHLKAAASRPDQILVAGTNGLEEFVLNVDELGGVERKQALTGLNRLTDCGNVKLANPALGSRVQVGEGALVNFQRSLSADAAKQAPEFGLCGSEIHRLLNGGMHSDGGVTATLLFSLDEVHPANWAGARFVLNNLRVHGADKPRLNRVVEQVIHDAAGLRRLGVL